MRSSYVKDLAISYQNNHKGTKQNGTVVIIPLIPKWRGIFTLEPANEARTHTTKITAKTDSVRNRWKEIQD